ncbi:hypothetical protein I302_104117 [Kwoniella bestiolae CBS 10118]|uniref:HIT-type domain-containing protein n=1 Tax=Kwoniella bestiolae CBS 10118 TaxID=1296100 RepID=A0A1B9GAC5_9TREE|nr:hypothetical protein I302_02825 [Kwoniella bestiolae CBS 10118]OCF27975.1 hypothetical protein I302_02825 [Kwoniella bestiolae CBS 10118]
MNHPLPPRPNFIPSSSSSSTAGPSNLRYQLPTPISTIPIPTAKPSAPPIDPTKCSACSSSTPKYTCPRCSKRSCSLACTKKHKSTDKCSGVRDPTSFVPLTAYGQGAWSDDYKWLEEGRRKVTEWGENVGFQELMDAAKKPSTSKFPRNERERNMNKFKKRNSRKELLKRELLMGHNCSVEFMPVGMEKKKANQSSWNPKTKQLQITIHLNVPSHLLDPSSTSSDPKTLTHPRLLFTSPSTSKPLATLSSLITPSPSTKVVYLLPFQSTPSRPAPGHTKGQKLFYPPLNPSKSVAEALGGTAWVEFPVIEIMEKTRWNEGVEKGEYMVVPLSEPLISLKDRTRDSGWGKRKIDIVDAREGEGQSPKKAKIDGKGLMALGDYASDDEDDVEDDLDAEEEEEQDEEDDVTLEGDYQEDEEEEEGEEEPSIEVLRAVGAALAADLG